MNLRNEIMVALFTMRCRSSLLIPCVMVRNTGMVPSGLVNVKNEVKHNKANGSSESIRFLVLVIGTWLRAVLSPRIRWMNPALIDAPKITILHSSQHS